MDELSIRCETERSESLFLGFISDTLIQSICLLFCDSPHVYNFAFNMEGILSHSSLLESY